MSERFGVHYRKLSAGALAPPLDAARITRFIISGGIAASVNLALLYLFTSVVGMWYVYSAMSAYVISFVISFTMQKFWTFRSTSLKSIPRQLPLYLLIQTFNLWVATYGLYLLVEYFHIWYMLGEFGLLALIAIWNFFLFQFVIFKKEAAATTKRSWIDFWNDDNSIYISEGHKELYYRALGAGVRDALRSRLGREPLTLLDFGAGYGLTTDDFVAAGMRVWLHDPTPRMEMGLRKRFDGQSDVRVLSTNEYAGLPKCSVDVILVFSVLQYVAKKDTPELIRKFRGLLKENGVLLVGDIVLRQLSMAKDTIHLLKRAATHGFFFATIKALAKTFFSEYQGIRDQHGFSAYDEQEILSLIEAAGFKAERISNIGFDAGRMTIKATACAAAG